MKTAIVYVSKYGTTEKVAASIAEKLKETNEVVLFSLKKNPKPNINGFETVILGSPIYMGKASGKMRDFCKANEPALLQKEIGLFICGMHIDKEEREKELKNAYPKTLHEKAKASGFLGGEFLFEQMNFFERFIARKIAKTKSSVHRINGRAIDMFVGKLK